jgi:hypothetical protein
MDVEPGQRARPGGSSEPSASWQGGPIAVASSLRTPPSLADVAVMAALPHSGAFRWRDWYHECGPIIDAVLQHVVIVVAPLAGQA